jgi:hypothetical protein
VGLGYITLGHPQWVTYKLVLIIFFILLIKKREKLTLDQKLVSYTHYEIMWGHPCYKLYAKSWYC